MTDEHSALLETARDRFKLAAESDSYQREQESEDLRFQVPELQWADDARRARMGDKFSPARPMPSITQLDAPIRLTRNQARAAKLGVNIHPVTEGADEETAEASQGLYRRIERDSNATTARMWAFDRALKCGRGYYRVTTRYDEDSPETFDQEIGIERILYQGSVFLDPAAQEPDWSDGRFAFVVVWISRSDFNSQFPGSLVSSVNSAAEWEAVGNAAPGWTRGGYGKDDAVQVAEYWFKEVTKTKIKVGDQEREGEEVKVYVCKLTGAEVIEGPTLWNGRYIPIVPVLGAELQPFDERRRFAGMITNAKDGQRVFNYGAGALIEGMSLEPKAPYLGDPRQFEGFEEQWLQANTRNFPFLPYNAKLEGDQLIPPPQRSQVDGTRMNLAMMALQAAQGWIQSTTAVHEPSLGRTPKDERSGRALLALQGQSEMSTGDYISNLAEIAMAYEAKVVLDLMPKIYDREQRVTMILRGDDMKSEPVMLNAPFVMENGKPRAVPKGTPGAKHFNLAAGRYGLNVEVGRSYRTKLQEGDEALTRLVEARPDLMEIFGDIWFQFRDHPGAREISKRLAKLREMKYPGLGEGEDGQKTPEQMQAENQRMGQQVQQLTQQLQGAAQALQTDQAKQQAQIAKAQLDQQTAIAKGQIDLEKSKADNETRLIIAAAQEETKRLIAGMEARIEAVKQLVETERAAQAQETAASERREGMAHEVAMRSTEPPPQGEAGP